VAARVRVEGGLHGVEQRRDALDLVDHHSPDPGCGRLKLTLESLGLRDVFAEGGWAGQVDSQVRRETGKKGGLADLPRAQQEHASRMGPEPG
jgi:hypothetical protein